MNTSYRLEQAITKLYVAFNKNELHPECCQQCAVGTILDNSDSWKHLSDQHGSLQLNYVGLVHQNLAKKFNGYTTLELLQIEAIFLKSCGYSLPLKRNGKRPNNPQDPDLLFSALSETITFLCKIDGIADVMAYDHLCKVVKNRRSDACKVHS